MWNITYSEYLRQLSQNKLQYVFMVIVMSASVTVRLIDVVLSFWTTVELHGEEEEDRSGSHTIFISRSINCWFSVFCSFHLSLLCPKKEINNLINNAWAKEITIAWISVGPEDGFYYMQWNLANQICNAAEHHSKTNIPRGSGCYSDA